MKKNAVLIDERGIMSRLSTLIWALSPGGVKLKKLKKQGLIIGDGCEILNGYNFGSEPYLIEIGNCVRITKRVEFATHDGGLWVLRHLYPDMEKADKFGKIVIGDNVHIGIGAIILPGVSIGANSIIGAGAIVTKSIPPNSVAVGVPAKVIESVDTYYEKNKDTCINTKGLEWNTKRRVVLDHFCN